MGMMTTSCEDMLTPDSERHQYEVAQDTLYSYWGILKSLQNIAERYVILNECRGDLVGASEYVSDTIAAIMNFGQSPYQDKYVDGACAYLRASDYYHVINSCNAYIAMCDTFRMTGLDQRYMIKEYAQVEAIRAWTYIQLVNAYGEVPFYLEPLLTTDDINNFINNPKHETVNPQTLCDKLIDRLIPMEGIEKLYGFPSYQSYGGNSLVCHSSKCMFPVSLVMGDLYLMKGREGETEAFEKAAQCYYNYLNTRECGPITPSGFYSRGDEIEGEDEPIYGHVGNPFTETNAVARATESITCIPSNRGRLDGKVNTDINRLFGFKAALSSNGSGDASRSSITLSAFSERELIPSRRYEALCDSVPYEVYIGVDARNPTGAVTIDGETHNTIAVLPRVGDARQSWAPQYTFAVGESTFYGKFVNKQNPDDLAWPQSIHNRANSASFTTVYPMVYRKSTVWLRFAEALNRAGFPSYAFAILQKGLCNNDTWIPQRPIAFEDINNVIWYDIDDYAAWRVDQGYDPIEVTYAYVDSTLMELTEDEIPTKIGLRYTFKTKSQEEMEAYADSVAAEGIEGSVIELATDYQNYPSAATAAVCYFLDRREVEKAEVTPYLYLNTEYMKSTAGAHNIFYKLDTYNRNTLQGVVQTGSEDETLTLGIHSHGGGRLAYNEHDSRFNYVDMVIKKAKENYGVTLNKEAIYSDGNEAIVQKCVEDLIIDEMGMELAFEGTRFSDLSRVALRRNDPNYLAERVAQRNGYMDQSLYNLLSQPKNWYLPLPQE